MPFLTDEKCQYSKLGSEPRVHDKGLNHGSSPTDSSVREELVWRRRFFVLLISSLSVTILLTGGSVRLLYSHSSLSMGCELARPYTPAPVRHITRSLRHAPDAHKFSGDPRPELDEAWHETLSGTLFRLSPDELGPDVNYTNSIRHKEGGLVGVMGVSHNLHCVKRVYQYIHPDYYSDVAASYGDWDAHLEHCLEVLRQAVLCAADTSVYALQWKLTDKEEAKPIVVPYQPSVCVDWDPLHAWMRGRESQLEDLVGPSESIQ
ncbi:hypothetical protein B0H63DRAFT_555273 [Podospora didyma]|uniref:Tat pathway signal sequence n=1 Tax=Podospora didyma TaxID=330526 RepID=A0AAE0P661_9PEZI|nr:hypothetical protein B0H63DRAFT_555273 [Podospora didyma]